MSRDSFPGESVDLPEIEGERCVHSLCEVANCRACEESCPYGALQLTDEALEFDASCCDGCGFCVPACPERAILLDDGTNWLRYKTETAVMLSCEKSDTDPGFKNLSCTGRLGPSELLDLHEQGIRLLAIAVGDCAHCSRGGRNKFEDNLENTNQLLASRSLAPLKIKWMNASDWLEVATRTDGLNAEGVQRRLFFRRLPGINAARVDIESKENPDHGESGTVFLNGRLPGDSGGEVLACFPDLNAQNCTACLQCVKICPHDALTITPAANQQGLQLVADVNRCSGCGLCSDICEDDALEIRRWNRHQPANLLLQERTCRACGVGFFLNTTRGEAFEQCHICRNHVQRAPLYQVLD